MSEPPWVQKRVCSRMGGREAWRAVRGCESGNSGFHVVFGNSMATVLM